MRRQRQMSLKGSGLIAGRPIILMSALPPKADMCSATRYVRFVPIADIQEFGFRLKKNPGVEARALYLLAVSTIYCCSSISAGRHVLSNHGSNGP
jgi:hypothetical protein